MKQHTVPQNIMSVEFKIFGDLTARQFIYVTIAGGLAFIFYLTALPGIIQWPLIVLSVITGFLITFGKVNERPFDIWINNFVTAILVPTQRIWKKERQIPYYLSIPDTIVNQVTSKKEKTEEQGYKKVINYINSRNLPTDEMYRPNTKLDIEEIKMLTSIDKVIDTPQTQVPPVIPISDSLAKSFEATNSQNIAKQQAQSVAKASMIATTSPVVPQGATVPSEEASASDEDVLVMNTDEPVTIDDLTQESNIDSLLSSSEIPKNEDNRIKIPAKTDATIEEASEDIITIEPNTVVKLEDLKDLKTSSLDALDKELLSMGSTSIDDDKSEASLNPVLSVTPDDSVLEYEAPLEPQVLPSLEIKPIENVLTIPEVEPVSSGSIEERLHAANHIDDDLKELKEENERLKEEIKIMQIGTSETQAVTVVNPETEIDIKIFGHMPDFVRYPNIISGVVIDSNDKLIEDVVVIIKDKSKRIMRAMKTNILGQFFSRNPLPDGIYYIEANKADIIFETPEVELKGEVEKPILIKPKKFSNAVDSGMTFNLFDHHNNG